MTESDTPNLDERLKAWLGSEGYPLEFYVASLFQQEGFHVFQGMHIQDNEAKKAREVDVLAHADTWFNRDVLLRLEYVVECKWTQDKPWVIFTSRHGRIAPPACVAQTIASKLGEAILWAKAGEAALHATGAFSAPDSPGFSGRQAFSKSGDVFYATMQAVVNKAHLIAKSYDSREQYATLPRLSSVLFPVIVIDGQLFKASYATSPDQLELEEVPEVRLHWKGSDVWQLHATVDIVTKGHLSEFLARCHTDRPILETQMKKGCEEIVECFTRGDLEALKVTPGGRGVVGLPRLLHELVESKSDSDNH